MIETYVSGVSTTKLMKQYGIGKGVVLRILDEAGVTRKVVSPTEQQLIEAAHLYTEEKWSLERIGQHFGFRAGTIHRHLKQRGVVMRRPWDHLL